MSNNLKLSACLDPCLNSEDPRFAPQLTTRICFTDTVLQRSLYSAGIHFEKMVEASQSELYKLFQKCKNDENIHMIESTVDTGLEWQAVDECKERVSPSLHVVKQRGKIYFNINITDFPKVQQMRSIDNIFIVSDVHQFIFSDKQMQMEGEKKDDDKTEYSRKDYETEMKKKETEFDLNSIKSYFANDIRLNKSLDIWKLVTGFQGKIYPTLKEFEEADADRKFGNKAKQDEATAQQESKTSLANNRGRKRGCDPSLTTSDDILKYRVTCARIGKQSFESGQVACVVGGVLQDKFNWLVDLTSYHLEVVCNVVDDELITCLRVTHESKHRRNIAHFGPTTLRATLCYSLIRLADPQPGEFVFDPMCGGGSILIEGAIAYPETYVIGGDNHEKAVTRTKLNMDEGAEGKKIDLIRWSLAHLPLKDSSVDVVVTDMPFGKRSGSMTDNRVLYKKFLVELGRVAKMKSGRLVLMTYDRRSMQLALQLTSSLFRVIKMLGVNVGGLHAAVYVLKRTRTPPPQPRP